MTPAGRTEITVPEAASRLDAFLKDAGVLPSRAVATRLVREGHVLVNGRAARPSRTLAPGDQVTVDVPAPTPAIPQAEDIPLSVLYEDDDLMVVDKPPGMVVHPGAGTPAGTLVNALLARHLEWPSPGGAMRPGIVHRLDKGTSGLLLVARTDLAQRSLSADLAARRVHRTYRAIASGSLTGEGLVEAPIGRDPRERKRMAVVARGREARTHFTALEQLRGATLLEIRLETGRTHQVRVHLAAIGHPLVGDVTYGRGSHLIARPALHSWQVEFKHPRTGQTMRFRAEPPADFQAALETLRG